MAKRIDEIRQKVETEGEVFVSDLSRIYNVTEETIRRDLEKLKNAVSYTHLTLPTKRIV